MFRPLTLAAFCSLVGFGATASTLTVSVDLVLRVDALGLTDVELYDDDDTLVYASDYMDIADDPWGADPHETYFRHSIGEELTVSMSFEDGNDQLETCDIGTDSCSGAYGSISDETFNIGDGSGFTAWGDFSFLGGVHVGDTITLDTFSGAPFSDYRPGEGYFAWDSSVRTYTVVESHVVVSSMPIPASLGFLAAGLGGITLVGRRARKARADA